MRSEEDMLQFIIATAQDDERVSAHLEHVRGLPKDAKEMYHPNMSSGLLVMVE